MSFWRTPPNPCWRNSVKRRIDRVIPTTAGLKPTPQGIPDGMTERTSDEEDHADYTDDHQEERRIERPGAKSAAGDDVREIAPDVADSPDHEPPD